MVALLSTKYKTLRFEERKVNLINSVSFEKLKNILKIYKKNCS